MKNYNEIEKQYQNEKKVIQQELEIELKKSEYYTQRAKEIYNELKSLKVWYVEAKQKIVDSY